jgi:hypothetical protein
VQAYRDHSISLAARQYISVHSRESGNPVLFALCKTFQLAPRLAVPSRVQIAPVHQKTGSRCLVAKAGSPHPRIGVKMFLDIGIDL